MKTHEQGIKKDLQRELSRKVVEHRDRFYNFFVSRYIEMLANLYQYNIKPFNKGQVELTLRQGYGVVFGKNILKQDTVIGYTQTQDQLNMPDILYRPRLTGRNITWTLPKALRPEGWNTSDYVEIWEKDNGLTGDFVVIQNKTLNLTSDYSIIQYYAEQLAEIVASRFSLVIQSKIMTAILGEPGDTTVDDMISALYNGNPFIRIGRDFDIEDNVLHIDNSSLASNLAQLKTEYQNELAELNASFGINILSVDKSSGVTTSEANGNLSYVTGNANIWLESRQKALDLYNARFGTDYTVKIDTDNGNVLKGQDGEGTSDNYKEGELKNE